MSETDDNPDGGNKPPTDRETFLEGRKCCVGSSDIAALCGVSSFRKYALDVYLDKTNRRKDTRTPAQQSGIMLEDVIAQMYAEETGLVVVKPAVVTAIHPSYAWMGASVDRLAHPPGQWERRHIAEIKNIGGWSHGWGSAGTDQVPIDYFLQTQWQMAVLDLSLAVVVVLKNGQQPLLTYPIHRDEGIIRRLIEVGQAFWGRVEQRNPPPLDWSYGHTADLVTRLHPPQKGREVMIADPAIATLAEAYEALKARQNQDERLAKEIRGRLLAAMAGAGKATLPDGTTLKASLRHSKEHVRKASDSVTLTVTKPKENDDGIGYEGFDPDN